jgi:hypothetical protein
MKVLTVRQPWASLIVEGFKDVENRSWATTFRGKLGIHAAARYNHAAVDKCADLLDDPPPLGALIGSVTLVDCVQGFSSEWAEPEMWHWVLTEPKKLVRPRWMPGRLGLWNT